MGRRSKIEQVIILKSKFNLEYRRVFFGVARLLPDRIILKGWFYKHIIFLDTIQEVRWSSDLVVLGLNDGEEIEMMVQSAALWKYELQARCGFTDVGNNMDGLNSISQEDEVATFEDELFPATDAPSNGASTPRESSYRVKTLFAHDRPHTDR